MLLTSPAFGQAWSGVMNATRVTDWSSVGATITNRTTQCGSTITAYTGTAGTINTAIAACTANQFVLLGSGTFNLSTGVIFNGKSNVTLRGAGPNSTKLVFTGDDSCGGLGGDICIINATPLYVGSAAVQPGGANAATWTAGFTQGTTVITLNAIPSGVTTGSVVILDQANDTSDTSGVYICDTASCHQSGETSSSNGRTISAVDYNQTQMVTVVNSPGANQLTITPGLFANNWRIGQTPGLWWTGAQVTGVGIENLTVDNTSSNTGAAGIYFYDCTNCWVKGISSIKGNRNHVWLYQSYHVTIRDSYFYGTQAGASQSYGVETLISSDSLVENNIFDHIAAPIMSAGSSGNVYGYNYSIDNEYNSPASWMQNSYANHDAGNHMNLFEGNQLNAIDCDDIHGTGSLGTYFRNRLDGSQTGKTQNTHATNLYAFCRGYNIIGNVLGTTSFNTQYEISPSVGSTANCDIAVYDLGFGTVQCGSGTPGNDSLTRSTLMRWGNWDSANAAVRWDATESSPGAVTYISAQTTPASHTLASSWYVGSQPAFWPTPFGTAAYPPIGPDVTSGNLSNTGGFANKIPARLCYENTSSSGGILNFDGNCYYYASGTPVSRRR